MGAKLSRHNEYDRGCPRPKKVRLSRFISNVMLVIFFDRQGVIRYELDGADMSVVPCVYFLLAKNEDTVIHQPSYCPHLARADIFLFLKLECTSK
ncbi:hypothetical protein Trydic_g5810 [Trypoxylus dichotomus]